MIDFELNNLILEAYSKVSENEEKNKIYAEAVSENDIDTIKTLLKEESKNKGYGETVYRVDDGIEKHGYSFSNTNGVFFAGDLGYYENSATGYSRNDARKYVVYDNVNLWKPLEVLRNSYAYSWSDIRLPLDEAEKYEIEDENDEPDVYNGGEASTSTEGLARTAKKLGYDGMVVTIPQSYGSGDFTEYAFFDSNNVKLMEVTYDDNGELIPLSRRFDVSSQDMRY